MASEEPILELALSLHRQLRQLTDTHYRLHGEDALGTFLRVHGCVHQRVANSEYSSPDLLKLNHVFVQKCISTYENYLKGRVSPQELSWMWIRAFGAYETDHYAFATVLPLMAAAHILTDLEGALFYSNVTRSEYDTVFDHIVDCLAQSHPEGMSLKQELLYILQNRLRRASAIWRLRNCGNSLGIPPRNESD
jgi:hypothetical protein